MAVMRGFPSGWAGTVRVACVYHTLNQVVFQVMRVIQIRESVGSAGGGN